MSHLVLNVSGFCRFFKYLPKWCTNMLQGWCHVKLLPSRERSCGADGEHVELMEKL